MNRREMVERIHDLEKRVTEQGTTIKKLMRTLHFTGIAGYTGQYEDIARDLPGQIEALGKHQGLHLVYHWEVTMPGQWKAEEVTGE